MSWERWDVCGGKRSRGKEDGLRWGTYGLGQRERCQNGDMMG